MSPEASSADRLLFGDAPTPAPKPKPLLALDAVELTALCWAVDECAAATDDRLQAHYRDSLAELLSASLPAPRFEWRRRARIFTESPSAEGRRERHYPIETDEDLKLAIGASSYLANQLGGSLSEPYRKLLKRFEALAGRRSELSLS